MLTSILVVSLLLLEVLAIWFAWRAVSSARTSQGAVGWVIFLIAAPYLGVPMYLFLGHYRFKNYVVARRDSEEVVAGIQQHRDANAPTHSPEVSVGVFERIADLPVTGGNDVHLLIDGEETFNAIFSAIDEAKNYVLVQFYIIHDDELGRALQDRLIRAAQRGVAVKLMFDAVGSVGLPKAYCDMLREAGVDVVDPKTSRGPKNRFQLNFRNHRKTVVVDGEVGFIGGLNVGDEYMGRSPKFGAWRDTHAKIAGPVVTQLQLVFAEDWHWATEKILLADLNWEAPRSAADLPGMIVATGPGDEMETGALLFFSAIAAATKRVWIGTPYFVPDIDVLTALKHAALRGVDVRILVPDVIDHKIPWLAAFAYFDEIREVGARVFRYNEGFMHQKTFVVDDTIAAVGTTNFDNRSFRLNFEAMALFFDPRPCEEVATMMKADFQRAFELETSLNKQPRKIRIGAPIARLFSPVL